MQPRQMRETSRPVRPSLVYSMLAILHPALLFRERDRRAAALRCGFYPVRNGRSWCSWRFALLSAGGYARGTEGSNPSLSTGESRANLASCLTAGTSTDCGALDCPGGAQDADPGVVRSRDCGRDTHYWAPPAQNRTGSFPAYGSHLGCLTAGLGLPYALRRR